MKSTVWHYRSTSFATHCGNRRPAIVSLYSNITAHGNCRARFPEIANASARHCKQQTTASGKAASCRKRQLFHPGDGAPRQPLRRPLCPPDSLVRLQTDAALASWANRPESQSPSRQSAASTMPKCNRHCSICRTGSQGTHVLTKSNANKSNFSIKPYLFFVTLWILTCLLITNNYF